MKQAEEVAETLGCLSNPLRLMIVCQLLKGELYVQEIVDRLGTTKGNISQHLSVLLARKMIKKRRDANRIFYSIQDENLKALLKCVKTLYCHGLDV